MQSNSVTSWFSATTIVTALMTVFTVSSAEAQSATTVKDSIDKWLSSWDNKESPGLSIAVVKNGAVIYSKSAGMANIKSGVVNDSSTTFWIASVSKQFTAAAIYTLVLQQKISLRSSIRTYLPELPDIFQKVTIDHLIHHTSGIRDGFVLTALSKKPPSEYTNENVLKYVKESRELNFTPGSKFEYNNAGYCLLAIAIERVSGKTYPEYIREAVFYPAGMKDTYVSAAFPADAKQAEGYQESGGNKFQETHFAGKTYGSTGVISTLPDLCRWSQFLQNQREVSSLAAIREPLLRTGSLDNGSAIAYAGGLEKFVYRGRPVYEHFGADEGFKADMLHFPGSKVSVIGLTNNGSYYGLLRLLCRISDVVHEGRSAGEDAADQRGEIRAEKYYYDAGMPRLERVRYFGDYVTISSTPAGYAAPYRVTGDTMRSLDPFPVQFLQGKRHISLLDKYYQGNIRLEEIQPDSGKADLSAFAGEYFSDELQTSYKILHAGTGLQFEFVPGLTFDMFRINKTDFQFDYLGPNYVQFSKDGFAFSREGCRKLRFRRAN